MSPLSYYVIPCDCGETVKSHTAECVCPKCGRQLEVRDWGK